MIVIDAKTGEQSGRDPMGNSGFISWRRITEVLKAAGEIKPTEELTHLVIDQNGITTRLKEIPAKAKA